MHGAGQAIQASKAKYDRAIALLGDPIRVLPPTDLTLESSHLAARLTGTKGLGIEELVLLNIVEMGHQIGFAVDGFERMVAWKRDAEKTLSEVRRDRAGT